MDRNKAIVDGQVDCQLLQRRSGSLLIFEKDQVRKRQAVAHGEAEYRRTTIGFHIAQETRRFRVPKVLAFNDVSGEITFERIPEMETYLHVLRHVDRPERFVQRAAEVLGAIHSSTNFQQNHLSPCRAGTVFMHGDFGLENILYAPHRDELIIIDWSVAYWVNQPHLEFCGDPSLDLSVFLLSLFYRRPFSSNPIPRIHRLARVFLKTYFATRPNFSIAQVESQLQILSSELTQRVRQYHARAVLNNGRIKAWLYYPSLFDLQKFIKTLNAGNL